MRRFLFCFIFLMFHGAIFAIAPCKNMFMEIDENKGSVNVIYQSPDGINFKQDGWDYLYYVVFASNNGSETYDSRSNTDILESKLEYSDVTRYDGQQSIPEIVKNTGKLSAKKANNRDVILKQGFTGSYGSNFLGRLEISLPEIIKSYAYVGVAIITCEWSTGYYYVSFSQSAIVKKCKINKNPPSISMKDISISDYKLHGGKYYTKKNAVEITINGNYKKYIINNTSMNSKSTVILSYGENTINVKVVDYLFNESNNLSFNIVKDTIGPNVTVVVAPSDYEINNGIYESPTEFTIQGTVKDSILNADPIKYNWIVLDFDSQQKISVSDYKVNGDIFTIQKPGKYSVQLESNDFLGNLGKSKPVILQINRVKPVVKNIFLTPIVENLNLTKIEVSWDSETEDKNISYSNSNMYFRIKNEEDETNGNYSKVPLKTRNNLFIDLENLDLNRNKRNTIEVWVELISPYGVSSDKKLETFVIPAKLRIENIDTREENENIYVSINLSNTQQELEDYEEIYISRLPDEKHISANLQGDFYKEKLEDISVNGIKTDILPVSSACGHQYITYGVTGKIKGIEEVEGQNSKSIMLPNTKGFIEYDIKDSEGTEITLNTQDTVNLQNNLVVNKDGKVSLNIRGFDYDLDEWNLSLYKVIDFSGVVCKKLEFNQRLLENKKVENIGLLLDYGNNSYVFEWQEKNKQGDTETVYSSPFTLEMTENPLNKNGYLIKIANTLGINTEYVRTRPGEELIFETSSGDVVAWSFGDGSKETGARVFHRYHQNENQQTDNFVYRLEVESNNIKLADFNVRVEDTQQGALLENEVWRGKHFIYGTVIVPEGIKLEVKKSEIEETEIFLENSNYAENPASLYVRGMINVKECKKITVNNGIFKKTGIFIENNSENIINNTSISGLERGIVVKAGGNLLLKDVSIDSCEIGIHNFGILKLIDSNIENNYEYGLKDEYGASLLQDENNTIKNNVINHYLIK